MNTTAFYEKTPPVKLFFIAAVPGAVSMLASALYSIIDGVFVGRILGETAFAALNLAMPFVIINFSLADLIGVGSAVPISINLGQKNEEKANNIFTCACIMIVITGIIIGAILFFSAPLLMKLMGADGTFADFAVKYLRVYALCSPITTIVFAMDNYLRICGKVKGSMFLNILMSLISAALEFIFLYVLNWGIAGAAAATCAGMSICAFIALVPFFKGSIQLKFRRPHFTFGMIKQIIACGTPNFLNNIAGRITSILMNILLVRFGGESAVSIYGILMYVDSCIQPVLYGLCDSLQPAVGYNWGAGKYSRVHSIEKCCFLSSAVFSIISVIVIMLFPSQISELFMKTNDAGFMDTAVIALKLFGLTYITRWFSFATQSYMLAIEKSVSASLISVSTALVFPVFIIVILWPLGLTGLWLNFASTALLSAIMSLIILRRFKKQTPSYR